MSRRRSCQVLVLVLFAIGALAVPAFAGPPRTSFTGTETPTSPMDPSKIVPLNGNYYMLGMTQTAVEQTTDPRTTGNGTHVMYAILSADLTGPMWGTVTIENAGGAWTGSWQGQITREGADTISAAQGTFVGSGDYAGLISFWSVRSVNNAPRQVTGYITKGKVIERPMKATNVVEIVKVDMDPANWTWLAPNMAVIPFTTEDTGVITHLGDWNMTASGGTLVMFHADGSMAKLAQWTDGEMIAANGDKLLVFGWSDPNDPTEGYATIRGGTGRFANATGSLVWKGFYGSDDWWEGTFRYIPVYTDSYEGTITY